MSSSDERPFGHDSHLAYVTSTLVRLGLIRCSTLRDKRLKRDQTGSDTHCGCLVFSRLNARRKEGNVLFNDALNTLHFIYGYMASEIW